MCNPPAVMLVARNTFCVFGFYKIPLQPTSTWKGVIAHLLGLGYCKDNNYLL